MPSAFNSQVIVMNMALAHINKRQITSPTEASEEARKCSLFYDRARRAMLRACDWNFSTMNQALVLLQSVADSDFDATWATLQNVIPGYSYMYAAPSKCLRVRRIYNPVVPGSIYSQGPFFDSAGNPIESVSNEVANGQNDPIKFKLLRAPKANVMGIATDLKSAWTEFTFDITDESQFDDMFIEAFALELAVRICPSLTADTDTLKAVVALRKEAVEEAKRKNGGEGTEQQPRMSNYEAVRNT